MIKVMKYPIYPITLFYVSGIFCAYFSLIPFKWGVFLAILGLIVFAVNLFVKPFKGFSFKRNLIALSSLAVVFGSLGFLSYYESNKKADLTNLNETDFVVKVTDVLKPNAYAHRAYAQLISHEKQPKVLVTYPINQTTPTIGSVYRIIGSISEVPNTSNPSDFNYKVYLQHKKIYYQITSYHSVFKIGEEPNFQSKLVAFRNNLISQFTKMGYSNKTKGFIEALLFGVKTNLDGSLQQQFKDFGIMHVLAVSGMHVVILFSTITYVLDRLRVSKKVLTIILVLFLIVFSLMAGLSGSVVRASLMCLLAIIGNVSGRRTHTFNLLAGSMFVILLFEPNYLFDIGFQLSYAAVFSILFCYPVVQKYFTFKNAVLNYFGQLIGVSLIAQLGVLPISIYYFKQIPLLFLIGNLIAIPITTVLLVAWFVQLLISYLWLKAAVFLAFYLNLLSDFCFNTLAYLNTFFTIKSFSTHVTIGQCLLMLAVIYSAFWYFKKKDFFKIYIVFTLIILLQFVSIYKIYQDKTTNEVVLLTDAASVVFLNRKGKLVEQYGKSKNRESSITNYLLQANAAIIKVDTLVNSFKINNKSWLIVDSLGVYPIQKTDYVVIQQNAKVNIARLVAYTQPKQVILHNSNNKFLNNEYTMYLQKAKIPCYDMRNKGSFVIDYSSGNN